MAKKKMKKTETKVTVPVQCPLNGSQTGAET